MRKEEPAGRKSRAHKAPLDVFSYETGGGIVQQQLKSFKSSERRSTRRDEAHRVALPGGVPSVLSPQPRTIAETVDDVGETSTPA